MLTERDTVLLPSFVKEPAPLIMPLTVVSLILPKIRLAFSTVLPAPAKEAMVSFAATIYVAPLATVTAVLSDKVPVTFKVPADTVVLPV